jgi:hypothetical protein
VARRHVTPSPLDTLSGHKDYDQLLASRGKPRNVISHRGWQEPTPRQLRYIATLAKQTGRKTPNVTTRAGAKRAIDTLLKHRDAQRSSARGTRTPPASS